MPLSSRAAVAREELTRRQLARGGWSYFDSNQVSIEPTCLAMLALNRHMGSHREVQKLLEWQNSDGSWPAFVGDIEGSWTTALALSTINVLGSDSDDAGDKAAQWLLGSRGRESHWLWRWKFKLVDRQVRCDPDKFGWPWTAGSASWVIPTGLALIALKQRRACSDSSQAPESRRCRSADAAGPRLSERRLEFRKRGRLRRPASCACRTNRCGPTGAAR